jgi:hypothetical protein
MKALSCHPVKLGQCRKVPQIARAVDVAARTAALQSDDILRRWIGMTSAAVYEDILL